MRILEGHAVAFITNFDVVYGLPAYGPPLYPIFDIVPSFYLEFRHFGSKLGGILQSLHPSFAGPAKSLPLCPFVVDCPLNSTLISHATHVPLLGVSPAYKLQVRSDF